jgi:hypothetical protein
MGPSILREQEGENGHVRVGANKALALAGSLLFLIATWAVADHVKTVGRVVTIEERQGNSIKVLADHETRVRELEIARTRAEEMAATLDRIERMIRENRAKR